MFGLDGMVLAIIALAGCSAGAVAYALAVHPYRERQERQSSALDQVKKAETDRA